MNEQVKKILSILLFIVLFFFLCSEETYANNDTICQTATITHPNQGRSEIPQNEIYTVTLRGCSNPAGNQWIVIYYDDGVDENEMFSFPFDITTTTIDSSNPSNPFILNGASIQFSNFINSDKAEQYTLYGTKTYKVKIIAYRVISVVGTQLIGEIQATFQNEPISCGDIIPYYDTNRCPTHCSHGVDIGNNLKRCMPNPTPTPQLACRINLNIYRQIQNNQNIFTFIWSIDPSYQAIFRHYLHLLNTQYEYEIAYTYNDYNSRGFQIIIGTSDNILGHSVNCGNITEENLTMQGSCSTSGYSVGNKIYAGVHYPFEGIVCSSGDIFLNTQNFIEVSPTITINPTALITLTIPPTPTPQGFVPSPTPGPRSDDYKIIVSALGSRGCGENKSGVLTAIGCIPTNMSGLFATFLRISIGVAGGLAFLLIIFGGLRIILSSGHPEGMMEGKEIITSAIVGLLLIIFSVFLLRFIGVDVLKLPGFSTERSRTATPTPMSSPTPQ